MKNNKYVYILGLWLAGLISAHAQDKLAYIDENYVVTQLPEYKTIEAEMKAYEDRARGEIDAKRKEYDTKVSEFKKAVEAKSPDVILQAKQKEIQDLEQQIVEMQQNIQQEYQAELSKRLEPVYQKLEKAVNETSVQNGNIFILRKEALYYQVEENNLSDAILKKLGVTPTTTVANRGNLKSSNKIGVFDVNYALPQLTEFKNAEKELSTYQQKLKEGIEKLQLDLKQIEDQVTQNPDLPEAKRKELAQQYEAKQGEVLKAQQAAQEQFSKKQSELLEPIYKKLQDTINAVAQEQGYSYVLKVEASLFEPKENNISNDVLKKLGVTPQE
ncbi:MAG: OmpH family outer membrane protein [Microscillaceae bacterium]|nr:OmpH family outer membrane protein [Microscillaceae bacterium]